MGLLFSGILGILLVVGEGVLAIAFKKKRIVGNHQVVFSRRREKKTVVVDAGTSDPLYDASRMKAQVPAK